jgi:predicted negative regulator of RcsB-dependent stress response
MSIVPPPAPQPQDPSATPPPPAGAEEFALNVRLFWEKNRQTILLVILAGFLVILGREGWQWMQASRERGIQEEYAKLGERIEQLPKFASEHAGHALAGVAWLRLADDAYTKNDFKSAAAHYGKAIDSLPNVALQSRARLGAAMSQLAAGDKSAAETTLKALSADTKAVTSLRAEATYTLAVIAREAGKQEEARQLVDEVAKIEPMGLWAQRAFLLKAQLEANKPAAAPAAGAPLIDFKPKG